MIKIWKERIVLAKPPIYDTGNLCRSLDKRIIYKANEDATDLSYGWGFLYYGIYVNQGVGREVYKGNPGDIGRRKVRKAREWYAVRYARSVFRIREYMAESLGVEAMNIVESVVAKTEEK